MNNLMEKIASMVRILRNPIQHLKTVWRKKNPYQKYENIFNFMTLLGGDCFKFEVFSKRPNGPIGFLLLAISLCTYILIGYTVYYYIQIGEFVKCIPVFSMLGIMNSLYSALWNIMFENQMEWVPLFEMLGKYVLRNDNRPTAYNRICSECLDAMVISYIIKLAVIQMSFVLAFVGPVYTYFKDGNLVTLYEVRLPYLQDDPRTEFIINISWQVFISLNAVTGLLLLESVAALINTTVTMTSKLSVLELNELSDEVETERIGMEDAGRKLKNIILRVPYMEEYLKVFGGRWYWRLFISPPAFLFSISVSIFSQLVLGHPAGFGLAVVSYVQMVILCDSGQNVIDRNERILEAFYEFKWYLLPTKYQKEVLIMIHQLQNRPGLTMGPFETLNYETLKILTQKVYSITMFLIQFS